MYLCGVILYNTSRFMARTQNIVWLLVAVLLFGSCGVKKATIQEQTQAESAVVAPSDSLAFLGELVNDSTIHVNWEYGVPFIIDDNVPMFLPPIDKNPEGYVCKHIKASCDSRMSPEAVAAIVDSIPWINKCFNATKDFIKSQFKDTLSSHRFDYHFYLNENAFNRIIEIRVYVEPLWQCCDMSNIYMLHYIYFFDISGNLLGKMASKMPYRLAYKKAYQYPLRKAIPNYTEFKSILNTKLSFSKELVTLGVFSSDNPDCWRK